MTNRKHYFLSIFIFGILSAVSVFALHVPALQCPVNDTVGILTATKKAEIESFLLSNEKASQLQIAVLIVQSLEGEDLEEYSMRVADAWKLGSKEKNSGALLLIAVDERKVRIEVGYGLEENLTDAACSAIIRTVIAPEFRGGYYGEGILKGVQAMTGYALKDKTLMKLTETGRRRGDASGTLTVNIVLIILFLIILRLLRKHRRFRSILFSGSGFSGGFSSGGSYSGGGGGFGGGGASGGW